MSIDIILDPTVIDHERNAAALDLADIQDNRPLDPLISISQHPSKNDLFALESHDEIIPLIWVRLNFFPLGVYRALKPRARYGIFCTIKTVIARGFFRRSDQCMTSSIVSSTQEL